MRKFLILICACIGIVGVALAETLNVTWYNTDGTTYDTTTCTVGGTLTLPSTPPTKHGYTFQGWAVYTPIEYIESTGTQWINTGITCSMANRFVLTMSFSYFTNNYQMNGWAAEVQIGITSNGTWWNISAASSPKATLGQKYIAELVIRSSTGELIVDGVLGNSVDISGKCRSNSFALFNAAGGNFYSREKLYSFKAYNDNVLIRDFIPILDSDGVACMYDRVSGTIFYNAGTGDFVAGPAI